MKTTPEQAARILFAMTKGNVKPDAVAHNYTVNAETMRGIAAKAAASKSGKCRGYTAADALAHAAECDERAVSVPAELRRLLAQ